jgi:Na+-driven multidrug efflux pump
LTRPLDWAKTVAANDVPPDYQMTLRNAIKTLLVLVLALPVVAAVLVWVVGLLRAMGDAAGATVVGHVGTACNVVWLVSLVGLLVALASSALAESPPVIDDQELEPRE